MTEKPTVTWFKCYLNAIENLYKHPEGSKAPDKHNIGHGMTQEWNQNIPSRESVKKMAISFLSWMKKKKTKNLLVHLPARSPEHFPTVLMSIFRVLCQQNTSSTAPLRPAYSLEAHYQIHLFTEVFAQKLYKHSYTIEIGVLCNWHPSCYGPNVTVFTALNLNAIPPNHACRQRQTIILSQPELLLGSLTFSSYLRLFLKTN